MKAYLRTLLLSWLSLPPVCGQVLSGFPLYGHPSTAAVAGMADDAFGVVAQPGACPPDRRRLAGLRCLRLSVEGAPVAVQAAMVLPAGPGRISLQGWHAGTPALSELMAAVSYDALLWETFSMGVGFGYGRLAVPLHVPVRRLHARWGAVWKVTDGFRLSFRLEARPGVGGLSMENSSPMPLCLAFGIGYRLSEQASLAGELLREEGRRSVFTPVVYYRPLPDVMLKAGIRTDNGGINVSLTYRLAGLGVGAGGRQVGPLGWSGELCLDWRSKKGEGP